jgi:hypothetical protein
MTDRRHNYGQKCTKRKDCDCRDCCLCRSCLFDRRSGSLYRGMQSRFAAKKWQSGERAGEIRRPKRDLPFSLDQFRAWLRVILEDEPNCEYCGQPIDIMTISPDHAKPVSRGGSLALANLRPCCKDDNALKGELLPGEYKALLAGLKTFTDAGRKDVLSRLRGSSVHIFPKKPSQVKPELKATNVLALPAKKQEELF